jgi:hypothetical protein
VRLSWDGANVPAGYFKLKREATDAYAEGHPFKAAFAKPLGRVQKRAEQAAERAAEHVAIAVAKGAAKVAPVAVALAGSAAAALAAGLAGFVLGDALAHEKESTQLQEESANRAYRQARAKLEEKLGVAPGKAPTALYRPITDAWKQRIVSIRARVPLSRAGVY